MRYFQHQPTVFVDETDSLNVNDWSLMCICSYLFNLFTLELYLSIITSHLYFSILYSRHIKRISYHTDILTWRRNLLRIETDTNPLTSLQTLLHSSALRRVTYIALQTVLCCSFCVGENISSEIAAFNGGGRMVPPAATGKKKSKKNENLYVCNIVGFFKDYTGISTYIYLLLYCKLKFYHFESYCWEDRKALQNIVVHRCTKQFKKFCFWQQRKHLTLRIMFVSLLVMSRFSRWNGFPFKENFTDSIEFVARMCADCEKERIKFYYYYY